MQLLQFQPILKRIRWGGTRLGTHLGKEIGTATDAAESWEISDHQNDQSIVQTGPYAGWTLNRLVNEQGDELLGHHAGRTQFPLLVKFLDATDSLSVQVHPNDAQAKTYDPEENGKTEAWVILHADPGSRLYAGLKADVDAGTLQQHLTEGTVDNCLHSFEVAAGDCIFIPAGTVHAIGAGILLAEIQQSSDLTFRLFDWNRLGSDGKPRPLHIEQALACIDFDRGPVNPVVPQRLEENGHEFEELVRCAYFVIRRHVSAQPFQIANDRQMRILMLLAGTVQLTCEGGQRELRRGETILIPAAISSLEVRPEEECVLLESFLP